MTNLLLVCGSCPWYSVVDQVIGMWSEPKWRSQRIEKLSVRFVAAVFIQVRSRMDVCIHSSRFLKKVISPCLFWRVKLWVIIQDTRASELTGGEGAWEPTKTSWVHCRLWLNVPTTYPLITDWVHSKCSCRFQVEHMIWVHLCNILNVILTCAIHFIPHNS